MLISIRSEDTPGPWLLKCFQRAANLSEVRSLARAVFYSRRLSQGERVQSLLAKAHVMPSPTTALNTMCFTPARAATFQSER